MLGPRIIELDRYIRLCDPLYTAGGAAMQRLTARTGHSSLLNILYSNAVICVRDELSPTSPPNLFSRGQKRPLLLGAASKVILAHLAGHQLRRLYANQRKAIAMAGLGGDYVALRKTLRKIRKDGYCLSIGEVTPNIVGIAAAIFNANGSVLGSLGIGLPLSSADPAKYPELGAQVMEAARDVTEVICSLNHGVSLPARAIG